MAARRGFSLIELSAVLLIAAIAAGAVAIRLGGPLAQTSLEDAVGQIAQADQLARAYARQHGRPLVLVYQVDRNRVFRQEADDRRPSGGVLELPRSIRLRRVIAEGRELASGQAELAVSRQGYSPTYGLELMTDKGRQVWLLAAGLTGQVSRLEHEKDLRQALAAAGPAGPHAD